MNDAQTAYAVEILTERATQDREAIVAALDRLTRAQYLVAAAMLAALHTSNRPDDEFLAQLAGRLQRMASES